MPGLRNLQFLWKSCMCSSSQKKLNQGLLFKAVACNTATKNFVSVIAILSIIIVLVNKIIYRSILQTQLC